MNTVDFDFVRKFVRSETAVVLEPDKEYLVESRLQTLARRENLGSLDALVDNLRAPSGRDLLRKVVSAMTTHETSFFRDLHPFEALRKTILPEVLGRRGSTRQLNLWCGAASTGQEPYSILMLLQEHFPQLFSWQLTFVATDVCAEVVARARSGRFSQLEVNRGLPATHLVRNFVQKGEEWEIREDLRRRVDFREMNLVKDWLPMPPLDIVFLRNVLIYFDVETKKAILGRIRRLLRPGGYLLLGGAETTLNLDDAFERVTVDRTSFYRIKEDAEQP
jgi:chemotaxis protein methyltransferase CheR